jgi:hypothetical protein
MAAEDCRRNMQHNQRCKAALLFAGDDIAQEYVSKRYVNSSMPVVFVLFNEA